MILQYKSIESQNKKMEAEGFDGENFKQNTNEIQTKYKRNTNEIQTKYKRNTNEIDDERASMEVRAGAAYVDWVEES